MLVYVPIVKVEDAGASPRLVHCTTCTVRRNGASPARKRLVETDAVVVVMSGSGPRSSVKVTK